MLLRVGWGGGMSASAPRIQLFITRAMDYRIMFRGRSAFARDTISNHFRDSLVLLWDRW